MSKLEVDAIEPQSGTTITIGSSGDTVNLIGTLNSNGSPLPGDISEVIAGTGLSGGGQTGAVTLNIEAAQPTITSLGTLTGLTITGTGVVTTFKSTNNNTVLRLKGSNATNGGALGSTSSGDLTFLENLSEGMRLTSTGLGIGTTSPANNLHIFTDASGEGILVKSTGNTYNDIIGDSNRSGAGNNLVRFRGNWNGNGVAMIALSAGDDTTNKDDGRIEFFTSASGSSQNNRMVIEPNGNVGIGTTSPDDKFHVMRGDSGGTTRGGSVITAENSGNCFVTFLGASTSNCTLFLGDNINNNAGQLDYDHANDSMSFYTNQSEKVRIDSSGSVGIGTTAPFNSRPGSFTISNEAPTIYMEDTNSSGSGVGQILYSNGDLAYSTGTRNGTGTSNSTEHFRIKNDGNVGIGTTSPDVKFNVVDTGSNQAAKIHSDTNNAGVLGMSVLAGLDTPSSSGDCKWVRLADGNDSGKAYIQFKSSSPNAEFAAISDERLKTNIQDTDVVGLDVINNLRLVKFDWNETATQDAGWSMTGHQKLGFVAQEVEAIVPEFISEDTNGFKIMGDSGFVPYLIKAMQEQQTKIQELEARITTLENA